MTTLRFDYRFRGVGRVRVSAGTDHAPTVDAMRQMLRNLYRMGRLDVLYSLQSHRVTPLQVYAHYQRGNMDRLPTAEEMLPLAGMTAWAEAIPNADTRRGYRSSMACFLRTCPADAELADLPRLLRAYRTSANGPVMFNRTVMAIRGYLRETIGKRHPLLFQVSDIPLWKETPRPARPLTVAELVEASAKLGPCQGMAWTLALTGMRRGEYWNGWTVSEAAVLVQGGKQRKEVRPVPSVGFAVQPHCTYQSFRKWLDRAVPGHTPHSLRATAMHWWEAAGIPRSRRMMYLGHTPSDVSALYERHEVEGFLAEDAQRLRTYLGEHLPVPVLALPETTDSNTWKAA